MHRAIACAVLVLAGCALRPRYLDVKDRFPDEARLQLLDGDGAPVPGARIELGDRHRFSAETDQNGCFELPATEVFREENALVVVVLPKGVRGYRFQAAPGSVAPEVPAVAAREWAPPPAAPEPERVPEPAPAPAPPPPAEAAAPAEEEVARAEQEPPPPRPAENDPRDIEGREAGSSGGAGSYRRLHLGYGTGIGGGFARYTNGRHGEGFAWGVHGRLGYRFTANLAVSGMLWLDNLIAPRGSSVSNGPFSSPLAPGVWAGPALSVITGSLTLVGALLLGGTFTLGTGPPAYGFGGFGTMLALEADLMPWKSPLGRFGPFVRLGVAGLYDFALPSAFEVYVSANAGIAVELE